jgi:hypothetical protein
MAAGLLAILLAFGWMATRVRPQAADERTLRLAVNIPAGADLVESSAISPDGRLLAIVARPAGFDKLWIRPLNTSVARELAGTDGAMLPFWSPDSRSVGFFASGKLKRVEVAGGTPTVICNVM